MSDRTNPNAEELAALWARHSAEWRDNAQITSQWREAQHTDPKLLRYTVTGGWWDVLERLQITLLVTREYEHLVMALGVHAGQPSITYFPLPHPSGLVVDRTHSTVYIASTRNPNQIYDLCPVVARLARRDVPPIEVDEHLLVPVRSRFLPGCLYMHDLAMLDGALYANAVGHNAVVRLDADGSFERVWWPRSIEIDTMPDFGRNYLQLNSIAAGPTITESFFSASAAQPSARRPGHKHFPVDRRGVIFSGATREPIVGGLTRPHSARLYREHIWVDNSGYGEVGMVADHTYTATVRLPGWTRGLAFCDTVGFVGTSRVIPRFQHYAPGLDVQASRCGIHAIDMHSGTVLGSLFWPYGNQIFALDWAPRHSITGFPFPVGRQRARLRERVLFYTFQAASPAPVPAYAAKVSDDMQPPD